MIRNLKSMGEFRFLLLAVSLGLILRALVIPFSIDDVMNPARGHWEFGWEEGKIAHSIATGQGFSSPLFGNTGATAWTTPVYPYLLAGVFRVFGIYTRGAAWAILLLNALFSALTCVPIYFIAKRCFGANCAFWAAIIWIFFPYAIYLASFYVWGYCLDTLMLSLVVWCTLAIQGEVRLARWAAYGLLWGVAALTNPVILATLPFLLGWLAWRHRQRGIVWGRALVASLLLLTLTVSPWFVRNYRTFGRFIPFRGTFWMIFWEGNTGDTSDPYPDWTNPAHNDTELQKYQSLGELGYVQEKKIASLEILTEHTGLFLKLCVRRFVFVWTGFWSLRKDYLGANPFAFPNIVLCLGMTILMCVGMIKALREKKYDALPLLLALASYPAVYYVTHAGTEYRHPIDPLCVVFIAYAVVSAASVRDAAPQRAIELPA
jgi:4-amino-4-deoxy-L-arabinose transferase-like glycosyltransferase